MVYGDDAPLALLRSPPLILSAVSLSYAALQEPSSLHPMPLSADSSLRDSSLDLPPCLLRLLGGGVPPYLPDFQMWGGAGLSLGLLCLHPSGGFSSHLVANCHPQAHDAQSVSPAGTGFSRWVSRTPHWVGQPHLSHLHACSPSSRPSFPSPTSPKCWSPNPELTLILLFPLPSPS